jgi:small subunit ribosomal protein S17
VLLKDRLLETDVPAKTPKKTPAPAAPPEVRDARRVVIGVVTGDKMEKTIKVEVERHVHHPAYEKTQKRAIVCYAHDEKREAKTGDQVELMESRPLSRLKHWRLVRVISKAAVKDAGAKAPAAK